VVLEEDKTVERSLLPRCRSWNSVWLKFYYFCWSISNHLEKQLIMWRYGIVEDKKKAKNEEKRFEVGRPD